MLQTAQQETGSRSPQKLEHNYIHYLANFIQCLFSYGVMTPDAKEETNSKDRLPGLRLFISCLASGRKINQFFVESLAQTLSAKRSSIKKYVKLASDGEAANRTCIAPSNGQVGASVLQCLELSDHQVNSYVNARIPQ